MKKYSPNGYITFVYESDGVHYIPKDYEEHMKDFYEVEICGQLMSGKDFYDCVNSGCIIDYDGSLGYVFVNGYRTNLGLVHKGLCQGGFIVDGPTWLDLCDTTNIEVEWCNK